MGDLAALQAVWPTLNPGTTAQKLAQLNTMLIPGPPRDISIASLETFLIAHNILNPITAYATNGTNPNALIGCNYLIAMMAASNPIIHTSIPANFAAVQQLGAGLLADPATGVTNEMLAQLIGMISPPTPWWQVNGFTTGVTVTDLIAAGNLF